MDKKEFLSFSLPYDLMIAEINDDGVIVRISRLYPSRYHDFATHDYYKPILRPLSDLTKPIEHNGEKFVPIERLAFEFRLQMYQFIDGAFYDNNYRRYLDIKEMPFVVVLKLIEWHFNLFGRIDNGEAIDVNLLQENPYK